MNEQSSVYEGVGYNELYSSNYEPEEYIFSSPEREPFAHSLAEEEEEYKEDGEKAVGDEDEEGKGKGESEGDDEGDI